MGINISTAQIKEKPIANVLSSRLVISLSLFTLALGPRLFDLSRFLTADEFLWVDRSRNFLAGLTNPAYQCTTVVEKWAYAQGLACTLRTGHPGVTTMWTGSLGFILRWLADGRPGSLHDYVVGISTNPLDPHFITPERLGTVLITSLWVVAVYWLVRRLIGPTIALMGAALIALDPFHIALSRVIHHDALSTTFMTLSALCALIYWGQRAGRKWLVISGILAGFGFLSKSPALYLMPFIALTGLWYTFKGGRMKAEGGETKSRLIPFILHPSVLIPLIFDGLLWFAVAVAICFIFWPAMWVVPREALETVFFIGSKYATGGHAKGNYFLGHTSKDPGALFYPVTWLYRTSPVVIVGMVGAVIAWFSRYRRTTPLTDANTSMAHASSTTPEPNFSIRDEIGAFIRHLPLILFFILGYYLLMTIGEKKQDRYFLPVYPWLNLIAAFGLVFITSVRSSLPAPRSSLPAPRSVLLLVIILLVNGFLVAANFPYYFTYYNPLLGGLKGAAQAVTIGWGEGLDLAAAYLNQKPDVDKLRVASWYQSTFAPYYKGTAISYSKEKGKALAGDYVIFYINQTQRRFPDEVMFDYFEKRFKPDKIIELHGLPYAWIYPSLGVDHYIQDQTYTGIASLLAWQWVNGDVPLLPGQPAEFELYWEYLGKKPEERFFFRLVDKQDRLWAEGQSRLVTAENPPQAQWRDGEIIFERGSLTPPLDMPPGQYRLKIGFYTDAPAVKEGELLFTVPEAEALVTVGRAAHPSVYTLPDTAVPIEQDLAGRLTLLGASWPTHLAADSASYFPVELYWRVEQPLSADFALHVGLMDQAGEARQAWFNLTLAETLDPTRTTWFPGDILHTHWQLDLLPEVPPGEYGFELVLPDDTTQTLPFGQLVIQP